MADPIFPAAPIFDGETIVDDSGRITLKCVAPDWFILRVDAMPMFNVAFFGRDEHEVRAKWYDFANTVVHRLKQQAHLAAIQKENAA